VFRRFTITFFIFDPLCLQLRSVGGFLKMVARRQCGQGMNTKPQAEIVR
jgi:hypothetical protein